MKNILCTLALLGVLNLNAVGVGSCPKGICPPPTTCPKGSQVVSDAAGNITCIGDNNTFVVTKLSEIKKAVKTVRAMGGKLRAYAGTHSQIDDVTVNFPDGSYKPAVDKKNYFIDMNSLDKILEIDFHKKQVRVQGGCSLHHLAQELAKANLQLITQPGPYDVTVGGMASNAVHESGLVGCLCDSIVAIEIVDGHGNLRRISEKENAQWLPAARVSLGTLGIIYTVTFQCVPFTKDKVFAISTDIGTILANWPTFLAQNDRFQFLMDPVSGAALFETYNIANRPESNTSTRDYGHYLGNSNVVGQCNTLVYPALPTSAYDAISKAIVTSGVVDITEFWYKSYSYFHSNAISRGRIVELSIEAQFLAPAINELIELVAYYRNTLGIHFIQFAEVRYVSDKNFIYLSPSNRPSWMIGFLAIFPNANCTEAVNICRDFTLRMAKYGGRPQWGNNPEFLHYGPASDPASTLSLYGAKNVDAFNSVRRKFDPDGLFYTCYFEQRLGPL